MQKHSKVCHTTQKYTNYEFSFLSCPGVTNILQAAFMLVDHESVKKIENLTVFFMLLGSERVKVVHRTLMKLSSGVNFINILYANFSYKSASRSFSLVTKPKHN